MKRLVLMAVLILSCFVTDASTTWCPNNYKPQNIVRLSTGFEWDFVNECQVLPPVSIGMTACASHAGCSAFASALCPIPPYESLRVYYVEGGLGYPASCVVACDGDDTTAYYDAMCP